MCFISRFLIKPAILATPKVWASTCGLTNQNHSLASNRYDSDTSLKSQLSHMQNLLSWLYMESQALDHLPSVQSEQGCTPDPHLDIYD